MLQRVVGVGLLLFLLMAVGGVVAAQSDDQIETFVSVGGFQVDHPASWVVEDDIDEDGDITVFGFESTEDLLVVMFVITGANPSLTPAELLENREAGVTSDISTLDGLNGRTMAVADVAFEGAPGVSFIVEIAPGDFGFLTAYDADSSASIVSDDLLGTMYTVASSFQLVEAGPGGLKDSPAGGLVGNGTAPATLTRHDGTWQNAIEELQDAGVIGTGGSLVFNEPRAFFSGQGNYYTALAERAPFRDVVMAAEIDYTATTDPGDPEFCAILAGVQSDATGSTNTFIEVGFSSEQTFYIVDLFEGDLNFVEEMAQGVDLRQPQHVLVIIQNGLVTVYLNGELLAEELEVIRRSGSYGVSLVGRSSAASCIGNNIWVYQAPAVTPGLCEATAASTVNKRSGPGTENARAGQFEAGSIVEVVGQASDGAFVWWLLDDETWVREDVVSVIGDCANVPIVES